MNYKVENIYTEETEYFITMEEVNQYIEGEKVQGWDKEDFDIYTFDAPNWRWI